MLGNISRTGVRRALIDLSAVEVMDSYAYGSICDTATMASVMGTKTVLAGIKAGVASVLVEFDVNVKRVAMALNLETGLAMLAGWDGSDTPEAELRDDLTSSMVEDDVGDGAAGGRVDVRTVPLQNAGTSPVAGLPDCS
jgi:rsbT antagonist protein RsbS